MHSVYIEELKDKSENGNIKNSMEYRRNVGEWKKLPSKKYESNSLNKTVTVLCVQKFSNFSLYVINKQSQWILVKLRINLCFQKLLKLPLLLCNLGNFSSFWKHTQYYVILNFTCPHAITYTNNTPNTFPKTKNFWTLIILAKYKATRQSHQLH